MLGVPDERFGHCVAAVLQWSERHEGDLAAVGSALRESLAGFKVPVAYWVVPEIERQPSSKTDYSWAHRVVADTPPTHDRRAARA